MTRMSGYPRRGDRFGRYDVGEVLGRGGMGVVHLARHRDLQREVALKLLSPRDQELVRLVVWEELSVADAGRSLGIRPGTARTRYSRALGRLRDAYATLDAP